jgi:parvulin-like peptidyl-prolyl isomerase
MPKKKKTFSPELSIKQKQEAEAAQRRKKNKNTIITVASILAVIAIIIGIGYYLIYAMPMQRKIIQVNDDAINIDYLIKRCLMSDNPEDIDSTRYKLAYELLIKQGAPQYGIEVTEADIDQAIRDAAKGTSEDITDAELREWLRKELNWNQLSEKQYRDYVKLSVAAQRLQALLQEVMPTTGEHVHFHYMLIQDYNEALEIKARLEEGEDFATIAREISMDEASAEDGGDKGWLPVEILGDDIQYVVSDLDIGEISMLVPMGSGEYTDTNTDTFAPYAIIMITERAAAMEIEAGYLDVLKTTVLQKWLDERSNQIRFLGQGTSGGYDSETEAWIFYQIRKLEKSRGITTS